MGTHRKNNGRYGYITKRKTRYSQWSSKERNPTSKREVNILLRRQKVTISDFESLAIIGRGAFGEVRLCRSKKGEIVAIKKMNKKEMLEKN